VNSLLKAKNMGERKRAQSKGLNSQLCLFLAGLRARPVREGEKKVASKAAARLGMEEEDGGPTKVTKVTRTRSWEELPCGPDREKQRNQRRSDPTQNGSKKD